MMEMTLKTSERATRFVFAALLVAGAATAGAATLVVDDFTQGGFAVSESYRTMRESNLSLPVGGMYPDSPPAAEVDYGMRQARRNSVAA